MNPPGFKKLATFTSEVSGLLDAAPTCSAAAINYEHNHCTSIGIKLDYIVICAVQLTFSF